MITFVVNAAPISQLLSASNLLSRFNLKTTSYCFVAQLKKMSGTVRLFDKQKSIQINEPGAPIELVGRNTCSATMMRSFNGICLVRYFATWKERFICGKLIVGYIIKDGWWWGQMPKKLVVIFQITDARCNTSKFSAGSMRPKYCLYRAKVSCEKSQPLHFSHQSLAHENQINTFDHLKHFDLSDWLSKIIFPMTADWEISSLGHPTISISNQSWTQDGMN